MFCRDRAILYRRDGIEGKKRLPISCRGEPCEFKHADIHRGLGERERLKTGQRQAGAQKASEGGEVRRVKERRQDEWPAPWSRT